MDANFYRSFVLKNNLAAVSSVMTDDSTFLTDGFNCNIYKFCPDGCYHEYISTVHPYRRLRKNGCGDGYTAAVSCNARIYYINSCFCEEGYTELSTARNNSCGCNDFCELTDVSAISIGNENFIVGAFRTSAYLFDVSGKRLTRLCSTENGEILTDFVYSGDGLFAFATLSGSRREITISDNGITTTATLGKNHTLRQLFIENGEIYGLFGQSYIYNRIFKIYQDHCLSLPT